MDSMQFEDVENSPFGISRRLLDLINQGKIESLKLFEINKLLKAGIIRLDKTRIKHISIYFAIKRLLGKGFNITEACEYLALKYSDLGLSTETIRKNVYYKMKKEIECSRKDKQFYSPSSIKK